MAQKTVLGKGLASLLPNAQSPHLAAGGSAFGPTPSSALKSTPSESSNRDRHMGISMASVDDIQVNHFQPRREFNEVHLKELAQSIRTSGIIQPLVVRKTEKDGLELIAGERRLRAAKMAGLKQVPIVIRRSTDRETLELALIENIQRQDLNCVDEALAYFQLIQDFSLTQEEVADRVGKERATVANYLRLLRLPEVIIDDLKNQILTFGHGKALLGLEEADLRIRARTQVIKEQLSVRETEALVDAMKKASKDQKGTEEISPHPKTAFAQRITNLSQELARFWSTKVEIKGSERRGKIVLHYASRQELDRILEGMQIKK